MKQNVKSILVLWDIFKTNGPILDIAVSVTVSIIQCIYGISCVAPAREAETLKLHVCAKLQAAMSVS